MTNNLQDTIDKINHTQEQIDKLYMQVRDSGLNKEELKAANMVMDTMSCMADFLEKKIESESL